MFEVGPVFKKDLTQETVASGILVGKKTSSTWVNNDEEFNVINAKENAHRCYEHLSNRRYDILAEDMRLAHLALSSILGQNPTEELLDEIFTNFCIGK